MLEIGDMVWLKPWDECSYYICEHEVLNEDVIYGLNKREWNEVYMNNPLCVERVYKNGKGLKVMGSTYSWLTKFFYPMKNLGGDCRKGDMAKLGLEMFEL